jgi:predicted transposase YbfD/YdcC
VERLDLAGALVSIDAIGCNPNVAQSILDAEADYLLAVKDNQPALHADIKSYCNCPGLGASLWVRQSDSMGG